MASLKSGCDKFSHIHGSDPVNTYFCKVLHYSKKTINASCSLFSMATLFNNSREPFSIQFFRCRQGDGGGGRWWCWRGEEGEAAGRVVYGLAREMSKDVSLTNSLRVYAKIRLKSHNISHFEGCSLIKETQTIPIQQQIYYLTHNRLFGCFRFKSDT